MKKALAGPAKRSAGKPERPAMIAAVGRRLRPASKLGRRATEKIDDRANRAMAAVASSSPKRWAERADRLGNRLLAEAASPSPERWARSLDRWGNRLLVGAHAEMSRRSKRIGVGAGRLGAWLWPRVKPVLVAARALLLRAGRALRPVLRVIFRGLAVGERGIRQALRRSAALATRASERFPPERAACAVIVVSAGCLVASQFIAYHAVEIGQPGYAGLPAATPPAVEVETAGQAHAYLLVPLALVAGALAVAAWLRGRWRLGRLALPVGLLGLAVVLLVDLPAGLDAGEQTSRFSGATAVLRDGFYGEIAALGGLMLGAVLLIAAPKAAARYHARPCRTRTNSSARVASALRRRRRRRASSRARAARSALPLPSAAASAPESRP